MNGVVVLFGQTLVGLAFVAALVGKLRDPGGFAHVVRDFQVLPDRWAERIARPLLALEVLVAVALVVGLLPGATPAAVAGLGLGALLLTGYGVALAAVRLRKLEVACNCFGADPTPVSWYDVARNAVLVVAAALGLAASAAPYVPLRPADGVLVVTVSLALGLIVLNLRNIVKTVRHPLFAD